MDAADHMLFLWRAGRAQLILVPLDAARLFAEVHSEQKIEINTILTNGGLELTYLAHFPMNLCAPHVSLLANDPFQHIWSSLSCLLEKGHVSQRCWVELVSP